MKPTPKQFLRKPPIKSSMKETKIIQPTVLTPQEKPSLLKRIIKWATNKS